MKKKKVSLVHVCMETANVIEREEENVNIYTKGEFKV